MWLTYMSSGLTLDALILNVRDLQAALPIILRAEQHCVEVPIFFFIFKYFPPLLLNHVDVRHEVGNKLVFSIACNQTGFFASSSPCNYFTPFIMPVDRSDWLRPKSNLLD